MTSIFAHVAALRERGRKASLATVVRTLGSTPQVAGAKLVLDESDAFVGTLGGGCVEADAIIASREVLAKGGRSLRAYELTEDLAWNTGLVCGGTMWILAERAEDAVAADGRDMLEAIVHAAEGGPPIAIATIVRKRDRACEFDGRVFVDLDGRIIGSTGDAALDTKIATLAADQLRHGTTRVVSLDETRDLLIDAIAAKPRLVIAGGGHVALAITTQALFLGFDATVLEDRPEFADPMRFVGATVIAGDVPATLASLDYAWNSFIVIATRGHKLDADCVLAAARTSARYVGLLGSRRKTVLIEAMLREAGVTDERIAAIHAPVGLDLGGRTPAEIALSVMAEITQERYRASGKALRTAHHEDMKM